MPVEVRELVIRAVAITVSDACSRGQRHDESGEVLVQLLKDAGAEIVATMILADDLDPLAETLRKTAAQPDVNLIVTTGGTGFGPRDNTPEATLAVIERAVPGLAEAMRMETLKQTPLAMLSRGVCGIRSGTLIINLPGSPKAVRESFAVIAPVLPHALALLTGTPGGDLH
jgi:molybdopterin adenylyltransferase